MVLKQNLLCMPGILLHHTNTDLSSSFLTVRRSRRSVFCQDRSSSSMRSPSSTIKAAKRQQRVASVILKNSKQNFRRLCMNADFEKQYVHTRTACTYVQYVRTLLFILVLLLCCSFFPTMPIQPRQFKFVRPSLCRAVLEQCSAMFRYPANT